MKIVAVGKNSACKNIIGDEEVMKGKKVKKDTQRISLYRVRLEKDRDLIKERRAIGIVAPEEIVEVIRPVFDGMDREQFVVLYLI